jgi:hypothetical protein
MTTGVLLAKREDSKERSVARIIPIQFIPEIKVKEWVKPSTQNHTILFYSKPIFRAKKYELF